MKKRKIFESRLKNIGIIDCYKEKTGRSERKPLPFLTINIPLLCDFLEEIVSDWETKMSPYQKKIDNSTSKMEEIKLIFEARQNLRTSFLKCIFSYVIFFQSLKESYEYLHSQLKEINRLPFLGVKEGRKPGELPYLKRIQILRNISIVHMGDKQKREKKDSNIQHSIDWKLFTMKGSNLNTMTFCPGRTVIKNLDQEIIDESDDLEIRIPEMHENCIEYIDRYDLFCAEFLNEILKKLPKRHGGIHYSVF